MKTPIRKQYALYQGIPQALFQGQQIQTQPFEQLYRHLGAGKQTHLYDGYKNSPYFGNQVPYDQNPPYLGMKVPIAQAIPSYPGHPPRNFNRYFPSVATLELPKLELMSPLLISHGGRLFPIGSV